MNSFASGYPLSTTPAALKIQADQAYAHDDAGARFYAGVGDDAGGPRDMCLLGELTDAGAGAGAPDISHRRPRSSR